IRVTDLMAYGVWLMARTPESGPSAIGHLPSALTLQRLSPAESFPAASAARPAGLRAGADSRARRRLRGRSGPPPGRHYSYCSDSPKRSEEHTSELQSRFDLVCRLLLEKKNSK